MPGLVDSHCHLQHPAFDGDRDEVIERARAAGIVSIVVPGWDLASSQRAVELAAVYPDLLVPAVGVHPHHAAEARANDWQALEGLAREPSVVAVGEIGLDFYRNLSPQPVQLAAFTRQLEMAGQIGKPVIVHDRDAHQAIAEHLSAWSRTWSHPGSPGVLHCFSGDASLAITLAARGFLVSFALPLAFRSATGPREAVRAVAANQVLVETDSPWLGPGPDTRNEPRNVARVAAEVARLRGVEVEEVVTNAGAALRRLLGRE